MWEHFLPEGLLVQCPQLTILNYLLLIVRLAPDKLIQHINPHLPPKLQKIMIASQTLQKLLILQTIGLTFLNLIIDKHIDHKVNQLFLFSIG